MWHSLVEVNNIKEAVTKLKEINWLYKEVDDSLVDESLKEVIEVVSKTSSTMLEKATCGWISVLHDKKSGQQPLNRIRYRAVMH